MRFLHQYLLLPAALGLAAAPQIAAAQAQEPAYAPLMARFNGTDALMLAPSPALDINGYGTIEFWVRIGWTQPLDYDPAIMSYAGASGTRFAFHITGNADALGVQAGPFYDTVDFDFTDGALHHVAIIAIGDTLTVMIDGEIRDVLGFGFADIEPTSFSIASVAGYSPFIGDIGQVRIWDEPIDPDVLVVYSWRPLAESGPDAHPDSQALVGASVFANPEVGGFVFSGEPDDPEAMLAPGGPIGDISGLDPNGPNGAGN